MGWGTTPMTTCTVSPAVLQTVTSIMAGEGGGGGMSSSSAGVGSSGTSGSTVNPPMPVATTSGALRSVTTTVACSQCVVNPANPGHILCQKCFQLAS